MGIPLIHKVKNIIPIGNSILVADMNFKERLTNSGIYIPSDNGKTHGIRPRWARVYAVGPEQKDVEVGQWVLVSHGRWTRGVEIEDETGKHTIRRIDPNDMLLLSDEEQYDDTMSTAIHANEVARDR
jgi:co-chaperonin GroES (HSP10)